MKNEAIDNAQFSPDASESVRQVQLFRSGERQFAIFTDEVAAIAKWREPTPLPHAPKTVLGVVSIQGRMLTVLDLAQLTGSQAAPNGGSPQHLLALRGDEQLALPADAIGETILLDINSAAKRENGDPLVLGILHREGAEVNILNLKKLFPTAIQGRERRRRRF